MKVTDAVDNYARSFAEAAALTKQPTEAQKEAGNYRKGKIQWKGLPITIENPKGSVRSGDGWSVTMQCHYGYINRTTGADRDQVDIFMGPDEDSEVVFVVDQVDQNGDFDEHKIMAGFSNAKAARAAYLSNYSKGWKCGPIQMMTIEQLKQWLDDGNQNIPATEAVEAYARNARPRCAGIEAYSRFIESEHPRETTLHDGKRPGEFAPRRLYTGQPDTSTIEGTERSELPRSYAFLTDDRSVAEEYAGLSDREKSGRSDYSTGRKGRVFEVDVRMARPLHLGDSIDVEWWARALMEKHEVDNADDAIGEEFNLTALWDEYGERDLPYWDIAGRYIPFSDWDEIVGALWREQAGSGATLEHALRDSPTGQLFVMSPELAEAYLDAHGHDGYVFDDAEMGGTTYVVHDHESMRY